MLLTITNTRPIATDLGYLLHKHPDRVQTVDLRFGKAHVFYPEATTDKCTAALLLDVDPIHLVRGRQNSGTDGLLDQYVNDRPYVGSSLMSVAIARIFGTALSGKEAECSDLAETPLPLEATVSVLPVRGDESMLCRLFEPLGYSVVATRHTLDQQNPSWGPSDYYTVQLKSRVRLKDLLTHLYVLMPVLDDNKHYWVGEDEIDKLLLRGQGWLQCHPEREFITTRYLKHRRTLAREALRRLADEDLADPDEAQSARMGQEESMERALSLNQLRLRTVAQVLKESGASRVVDLGCGNGHLIGELLKEAQFKEIVGYDAAWHALEAAAEKLRLDQMPPMQRKRVTLLHGGLTYRDRRLHGYHAAAAVEVIEHLDSARLSTFERVLFEFARPAFIVITTPNVEYNVKFGLPPGELRNADHRFEWTREQFCSWATAVAERYGFRARFDGIGLLDTALGTPTQMGIFTPCT